MKAYTQHRFVIAACRLCSLAIDGLGSYCLFVVVNRMSHSLVLATLWAVVFFVLAYSLAVIGQSLPAKRHTTMVIVLHALKILIAFFEAVVIANGLDVVHHAADTTSFTVAMSAVLQTNAGLVFLLFVVTYGLDVTTALLPGQLRLYVASLPLDLKPGETAWVPIEVGAPDRPSVAVTFEHVITGGIRDDVAVNITSMPGSTVISNLGSLRAQGQCTVVLQAGSYVLHASNDKGNELRRRGVINVYEI